MTVTHIHQKRHRLRKVRGETAFVNATPIRIHLATLFGAGWSLRSIAAAADVSATTLSRINRDVSVNAAPATIRKVLAVRPDAIADRTNKPGAEPFVPRIGTTRRLQALLAMGWGHRQMRERCGLNTANVLHQQGRWVTRSTHDAVAGMYADLSFRRGPSTKATLWAERRGYHGPTDWDDIDHDAEPVAFDETDLADEDIDTVAIDRVIAGDRAITLSKAERAELVQRWIASGRSLAEMERITGINSHRYQEPA